MLENGDQVAPVDALRLGQDVHSPFARQEVPQIGAGVQVPRRSSFAGSFFFARTRSHFALKYLGSRPCSKPPSSPPPPSLRPRPRSRNRPVDPCLRWKRLEAVVAMAASCAVLLPHLNGLGGDGLFLVREPRGRVHAIDAAGPAGALETIKRYSAKEYKSLPLHGADAAATVARVVAGWSWPGVIGGLGREVAAAVAAGGRDHPCA